MHCEPDWGTNLAQRYNIKKLLCCGTKWLEAGGNTSTSISVSQNCSLDRVTVNTVREISVSLATYSLTACVCKVDMYAWQHISSADLATAATNNLRVVHFNLVCFFRKQP